MHSDPEFIFRSHGGMLSMSQAIELGLSRYKLYQMRDTGQLEQISRGLYRLASLPPIANPDLVTVSLRYPKAVLCLVSALSFHQLTTQVPHAVSVAIPRHARLPKLVHPPILSFRFGTAASSAGIEEHIVDGVVVRVFSPEKTLADCFKYRNKIGMDMVLEALQLYAKRRRINRTKLLEYAAVCRVERIMRPYLEALL